MIDRCGKELQVGQIVDIFLNGMYSARLLDIRENAIAVANTRSAPPQVAMQIILSHVPADGVHCGLYITGDAVPDIAKDLMS